MHLKQLDISGIRNLIPIRLQFSPKINAFYGENGSGKTSVLEAIYVLGQGRSFRVANLQQVIQFEQPKYIVSGIIEQPSEYVGGIANSIDVGTERARDGLKSLFVRDGNKCKVGLIAMLLPLLVLDSNSFELLDGGPSSRRDFIDAGMFHVEHSFLDVCQRFRRCLQQRNAEIKADGAVLQKKQRIMAWNEAFVAAGETIDNARRTFLLWFTKYFNKIIAEWKYCGRISFQYKPGWSEGSTLRLALEDSLAFDIACGFTNKGPHRAELDIFVDGQPAKSVLSRGQQKVFVCAMLLAKAMLLKEKAQVNSIFLVDDLCSELDQWSFRLVFSKLVEIGAQIFITGIEKESLLQVLQNFFFAGEDKLFHVEQSGVVSLVEW